MVLAMGCLAPSAQVAGHILTALGDLPGGMGGGASYAQGIKASGQAVANMTFPIGGSCAFLWDAVGGMPALGALPGAQDHSNASGINNTGQVVGVAGACAFLWDVVNGMQDLNDLLASGLSAVLTDATAIKAPGQIVG
jgi:uncharacterized membrane protein